MSRKYVEQSNNLCDQHKNNFVQKSEIYTSIDHDILVNYSRKKYLWFESKKKKKIVLKFK